MRLGLIDEAQLEKLAAAVTGSRYGKYLLSTFGEG